MPSKFIHFTQTDNVKWWLTLSFTAATLSAAIYTQGPIFQIISAALCYIIAFLVSKSLLFIYKGRTAHRLSGEFYTGWVIVFFLVILGTAFLCFRPSVNASATTEIGTATGPGSTGINNGAINNIYANPILPQPNKTEHFKDSTPYQPIISIGCINFQILPPLFMEIYKRTPTPFISIHNDTGTLIPLISLYTENGELGVDLTLFSPNNGQAFSLEDDKIKALAPGWEVNHNQTDLEVVDQNLNPILQFSRLSGSHVRISGALRFPGYVAIIGQGDEVGRVLRGAEADKYRPDNGFMHRMFQYPSRAHPGELDKNYESPTCANDLNNVYGMGKGIELHEH